MTYLHIHTYITDTSISHQELINRRKKVRKKIYEYLDPPIREQLTVIEITRHRYLQNTKEQMNNCKSELPFFYHHQLLPAFYF